MGSSAAAAGLLARQLKQMQNDKDIPGISCGLVDNNVFEWEVMLMISDDCKFYGGTQYCTNTSIAFTGHLLTVIYRRVLPCPTVIPG